MMIVVAVAFLVIVLGAGGFVIFKVGTSLHGGQRTMFVVLLVIAAGYFIPNLIQGGMRGWHTARDIRQSQGR